jgi:signal transduction histidine kinase
MKLATNSLRFRYIASTSLWIAVGLILTGLMVSSLMRFYVNQGFHDEMKIHIEELAALTASDTAGQPYLLRRLSDPRFMLKGSGFYWEVRRPGFAPLRSPSLAGKDISATLATTPRKKWAIISGPTGKTLEYGMLWKASDGGKPYQLSIASDLWLLEDAIDDFNWPLGWALALFAMFMILTGAVQIAFGLKPLARMKAGIADIRTGRAQAMFGDYPAELHPIVNDLNAVLKANSEIVLRGRVQAGNLAHGLRTPLAILLDEADRLQAAGHVESAQTLLNECRRMTRHIDYHLARARAAAAQPRIGQCCSTRETIGPILSAMRRLHSTRNITICCANLPDAKIACDEVDLAEILSNLLDNACKWARSRVMISWESHGPMALLLIDDDGPGLARELREQAFTVGERLDDAKPGTGLGLAIVRDLVFLYGGTITLDDSPLGGLRASLSLRTVEAL